jgi:hypothetical protein
VGSAGIKKGLEEGRLGGVDQSEIGNERGKVPGQQGASKQATEGKGLGKE